VPITTSKETPPGGNDASQLSPRDRRILLDIIRTHTLSGEPVSSRTVSKHPQHHLSAASIRNVMADLEELGYLLQPHTSAGRVPTRAAYRLYVESLIETARLSEEDRRRIDEALFTKDGDTLMGAASHVLSEMSQQVGVVVRPKVEATVLKAVDFIPLEGRRVLCVVISTGGFIDNLVIETDEPTNRRDLIRISNYLTENFAGVELREIRDRLLGMMAEERAHVDRWLAQAIDLAARTVAGFQVPDVLVAGTTALFAQPEVRDVDSIRKILDTFADKARLVRMLSSCLESEGVRVYIGDDHEVTSELDFSLVATSYGIGPRALGSLGILGPARMEYPRIVALVRYLGETLSRTLAARC
jgi:heat-inducible transcriptional repressor